jgi:hypothetical protein
MRSVLALAFILICTMSAAPESEDPVNGPSFAEKFAADSFDTPAVSIEIESSVVRSARLDIAKSAGDVKTAERPLVLEDLHPDLMSDHPAVFASADPNVDAAIMADSDSAAARPNEVSMDDLCSTLYASAQNNDLPVTFFANLIWQESRMRIDDVSKKGAQGIAQFMPKTALEKGLDDPFDPQQALPASAHFLRELHMQFGNLGFVAAAYNAGPRRVIDWLQRRSDLPRETRNYVVRVTGLSVDAWRNMPIESNALTFVGRLPCRNLPAYANVEQTQAEETQAAQAKIEQAKLEEPIADNLPQDDDTPLAKGGRKSDRASERQANRKGKDRKESHDARRSGHEHHAAKREAEHKPHSPRGKSRTA